MIRQLESHPPKLLFLFAYIAIEARQLVVVFSQSEDLAFNLAVDAMGIRAQFQFLL